MPKQLKYETKLQIRISKELKNKLYNKLKDEGKHISDFLRELIEKELQK